MLFWGVSWASTGPPSWVVPDYCLGLGEVLGYWEEVGQGGVDRSGKEELWLPVPVVRVQICG